MESLKVWNWPTVDRAVHMFFGWKRFKNRPVTVPDKKQYSKYSKENKEIYQTDEFTVVKVDVDVGEALGSRLEERANQKRARSEDPEPCNHQLLLAITSTTTNSEVPKHLRPWVRRGKTEEPEEYQTAKRRRLEPPEYLYCSIEHDEYEMSGSSPGKRKRRQSSYTKVAEAHKESSVVKEVHQVKEEIADSADEKDAVNVDIEEVLSVKSVPRTTIKKVVEVSSSDLDEIDTQGAESNAIATGPVNEQKEEPGKQSSWLLHMKQRYNRTETDRYAPPNRPLPPLTSLKSGPTLSQGTMKPGSSGAPRPVNRLAGNNAQLNSQHSAPRQKPFDLTGERLQNGDHHPNKRRKMEGSFQRSSNSPELIDPETSEKTVSQNRGGLSAARSGSPQSASIYKKSSARVENTGVAEYHEVEEQVKTKRVRVRKSESSEPQTNGITSSRAGNRNSLESQTKEHASRRYTNGPVQQQTKTVMKHLSFDDTEDPISDFDDDKRDPEATAQKHKSNGFKKTLAVVELPGTESRKHNGNRKSSAITTESLFFPRNENQDHKNGVSSSRPKHNSHPPGYTGTRKDIAIDIESINADISIDDLSADLLANDRNVAHNLLGANNGTKKTSTKGSGKAKVQIPIDVDDSSDDQLGHDDIKSARFTSSKESKVVTRAEDEYRVQQAVSDTAKWKTEAEKRPWALIHKIHSNTLHLIKGNGEEINSFSFPTNNIRLIEFSESSPIITLLKSKGANTATKIYMQLSDTDECVRFAEKLKKIDPTIKLLPKLNDYLEKCLANHLAKELPPRRKPSPAENGSFDQESNAVGMDRQGRNYRSGSRDGMFVAEDEELTLINRRQARERDLKRHDNLQSRETHRNSNQKNGQQPVQSARAQGLARSMSLITGLHEDEVKRGRTTSKLDPQSFYGKNDPERISPKATHDTRASIKFHPRVSRISSSPSPERWSKQNLDWGDLWKVSIIYPRDPGVRNKTTVDKQDIERLDEGQFLNDNLINFYLFWLQQHHPELKDRVYFHNSFFYQRLTSSENGKRGFDYESVERWTSKVDLLKYDYIIVPVNEHYHWYLAIICNAPNLSTEKKSDDIAQSMEAKGSETITELLGLSSAPGSEHQSPSTSSDVDTKLGKMSLESKSKTNSPKSWSSDDVESALASNRAMPRLFDICSNGAENLDMEGGNSTEIVSDLIPANSKKYSLTKKTGKRVASSSTYDPSKPRIITLDSLDSPHSPTCTNLKKYLIREFETKKHLKIPEPGSLGLTAKNIPTQNNSCDCGLYLLGYTELFLENPDEFVRRVVLREDIDEKDWLEAPKMRAGIRQILFKLQEEQAAEAERLQQEKAKSKLKSKRAAQSGNTDITTPTPKPSSRDISKSAAASPKTTASGEVSRKPAKCQEPAVFLEEKRQAPKDVASIPLDLTNIKEVSTSMTIDEDDTKIARPQRLASTISEKSNSFSFWVSAEPQAPTMTKTELKPTSEVIKIDDSPRKPDDKMTTPNHVKHSRDLIIEESSHTAENFSAQEFKQSHKISNTRKLYSPREKSSNHNLERRSSFDDDIETPKNETPTSPSMAEDLEVDLVHSGKEVHEIDESRTDDPQLLDNGDSQGAEIGELEPPLLSSPLFSGDIPQKGKTASKRKHSVDEVRSPSKRHRPTPPPPSAATSKTALRDPSDKMFF